MNCGICLGYLREKNTGPGCNSREASKPRGCAQCRIMNCGLWNKGGARFCYVCEKFPCARLRQLDKRYRTRYGMSMIENLTFIKEHGIREFVAKENKKWVCKNCGKALCVHRNNCISCNTPRKTGRYS